jgi:hypothetical protein
MTRRGGAAAAHPPDRRTLAPRRSTTLDHRPVPNTTICVLTKSIETLIMRIWRLILSSGRLKVEVSMHTVIGQCPVCQGELEVARLHCRACGTSIEGQFALGRFHALSKEQLRFAEVFIKNRGNIKDVERELGISYPTVRGRLDALIRAMGYDVPEEPKSAAPDRRKEVLAQLERGEIDSEEAVRLLRAR